ncbi:hypothetical protein [Streptomyces sp. NPDC126514]
MTSNEWLDYWLARAPVLSEEETNEILSLMGLELTAQRDCDQGVS